MSTSKSEIVVLSYADLDAMTRDEQRCFPHALQANVQVMLHRLGLGHVMLGLRAEDELVGKICFSLTRFSLEDFPRNFPRTFHEFSSQPCHPRPNCAFVYNLNVQREHRRSNGATRLIKAMVNKVRQYGCERVIFDGAPVSYNSSPELDIKPNPKFKAAIDRYLAGGAFPSNSEFCMDPILAYYRRLGGKFLGVIPRFIPADITCGGMRVIMTKEV